MTTRMDLLKWLVERVEKTDLEAAGWKVESVSDNAIHIVGANNETIVLSDEDPRSDEASSP